MSDFSARDNSVTIAKALAIILMVVQHSGCPVWLNHYVRIFIMPLFFFMSGYCFKTKYLNDCWLFTKRRLKGIYWPIVKWSILFVALHNLFFLLNIYNHQYGAITQAYNMSDFITRLLHNVVMMKDFEPLLGGYWFMNSLLWGSLFFYFVLRLLRNVFWGGAFLLMLTFAASFFRIQAPFFDISAREFMAAFFIMSGYGFAVYKIPTNLSWYLLVVLGVVVGFGSWTMAASMLHFDYLYLFPYLICALCGILMTFIISKKLLHVGGCFNRFLVYCGNHTLDILTWHFLSFKIISLVIVLVYGLETARLAELPVIKNLSMTFWWVVYALIGIIVPLLIRYLYESIINRHFISR